MKKILHILAIFMILVSLGCIENEQITEQISYDKKAPEEKPVKINASNDKEEHASLAEDNVNPIFNIASVFAESKLPDPVVTGNSLELCLNSRVSNHSLSGAATEQQSSNVLWATGKAPITGSYRNIYAATPDGTYLYNPDNHSLSWYSSTTSGSYAFVISYERELDFDAGVSYMPALLASVSQWNGTESQLASCPKGLYLYFGIEDVAGLNPELAAHSSDGSLPDPSTNGNNNFEDALANLKYTSDFAQEDLSLQQVSQLLWAGYGVTPHITYNNRVGLTVPSAYAAYYLTGRIYIAKQDGVFRYHNRNPSNNLATKDHRIEQINSMDIRNILHSNVSDLSYAPLYIIICLNAGDVSLQYARLETGFAAGNMLMQASALDIGTYFKTELTGEEKSRIQNITGIPLSDIPFAIVSTGYLPKVHNLDTGLNYSTIQGAIYAGETLDGHTIHIDPGTYAENIAANKSITLRSENASDAIVHALADDHVFNVTADNVNISGLTVEGAVWNATAGIYLYDVDNCIISNNRIINNSMGIYLEYSNNNTIFNNSVLNNKHGIKLLYSNGNEMYSNYINSS